MIVRITTTAAPTAGTPPVNDTATSAGSGADLQPKAALYFGTAGTASGTAVNAARMLFGGTDGTTQRALGAMAENNQTALIQDCRTRHDTATVVQVPLGTGGAINGEAFWQSWQNGGSRIDWADLLNAASLIGRIHFFGADVQAAVVEFAGHATAGNSNPISGLAFRPDMAIFFGHISAYAADTDSAHARVALGFAVQTITGTIQQIAFTNYDADRTSGFVGATVIRDDRCTVQTDNAADGASLDLTAFTSDGATIFTRDASTSISTAVLLLGFGQRRKLYAGVLPTSDPGGGAPWLATNSTGNKQITVGFSPLTYFMVGTSLASKNATNRTNGTRSQYSVGCSTGLDTTCAGWQAGETVITASATRSWTTQDKIADVRTTAGAVDWDAAHVSMDQLGPTVNITTASAAVRMVGLVVIGAVEAPGFLQPQRRWRRQLGRM